MKHDHDETLIFYSLFSTFYFSCDIEGCDKTFVTRNALCSHLRSHERKLEDLKCSWEGCNRVFEMPCRCVPAFVYDAV